MAPLISLPDCYILWPHFFVTIITMPLTFSAAFTQQDWLNLSPMPHSLLTGLWRKWLLDKGSLTQNLKDLSPGDFSVKVTHTGFTRPSLSEARALGIAVRQMVYVREVQLCICNKAQVLARSVIPRSTLSGAERQLLVLNNKPLGEFLFSHKHMSRSRIEVKQGQVNNQPVWARRSIFKLNNKPLLVSEYFLAGLLEVKP